MPTLPDRSFISAVAERPGTSGPARPQPRRRRPIPESVLHSAWKTARVVEGRKGDTYKILYAGIPGGSSGPDFRNAIIETPEGALVRGDVEIHVRRSGWFAHGHHRDPAYNGVVFHVASEHEDGGVVHTASGLVIPLLLLKSSSRGKHRSNRQPLPGIPDISLAEAGDRRFFAKSSGCELLLGTLTPDELLWQEIMESMGYSANRKPFRTLARLIPWSAIAALEHDTSPTFIGSALLWAGGFAGRPDKARQALPPLRGRRPEWASHYGRPDNQPERRIRGIAHMAAIWRTQGGPSKYLQHLINETVEPAAAIRDFVVRDSNGGRALIGEGRAREITINAILPAIHAIARTEARWHLYERSLALYRGCPKTAENSVTKEMRRLLAERGNTEKIAGAREQQGLIYLYRAMINPAVA